MARSHPHLSALATALLLASACGGLPDGSNRGSQPAEVAQRMGSTELRVVYGRPMARGRVLFGELVPYDSIWNPGANEATRIEVSEDILIEGEPLAAGKYSIWAIPRPEQWTLIFSNAHDVFHIPYPEGQDALRMDVTPDPAPHVESLTFDFPMADRDSADLRLHWGELMIPLRIRAAR
jgi:hypothetical protein